MHISLYDLLKSKRFLVAVASVIAIISTRFELGLSDEVSSQLADQITTVACTFIGGMSLSDSAKALTMPAGVGHKG